VKGAVGVEGEGEGEGLKEGKSMILGFTALSAHVWPDSGYGSAIHVQDESDRKLSGTLHEFYPLPFSTRILLILPRR